MNIKADYNSSFEDQQNVAHWSWMYEAEKFVEISTFRPIGRFAAGVLRRANHIAHTRLGDLLDTEVTDTSTTLNVAKQGTLAGFMSCRRGRLLRVDKTKRSSIRPT